MRSPCRLFVGAGIWLDSLLGGGRIRMLLDKNPRAGFLSQHAPAGAARLQADCPSFPARLRRSAEEEDSGGGQPAAGHHGSRPTRAAPPAGGSVGPTRSHGVSGRGGTGRSIKASKACMVSAWRSTCCWVGWPEDRLKAALDDFLGRASANVLFRPLLPALPSKPCVAEPPGRPGWTPPPCTRASGLLCLVR